ncbi:hypothetical protein [Mucilaginibacter sp.]|uniref:hypothetical protein n=1 Tax=Mucilaginibacter sp. TaxID=1882438 RepID=UPI002852321D|nr:hypothetical protein [Mucilaginibacter sp.]MDR3697951.1 hypothetical protein [Mucilaginibacter sp.]
MEKTYRLKGQEISMKFLKSIKMMFAGQEVEITVKAVDPEIVETPKIKNGLLEMIRENRQKAPLVPSDLDIRGLIDEAHNPA